MASKAVIGIVKAVSLVAAPILAAQVPELVEKANKSKEIKQELQKNMVMVPDVIGANISDAQNIITKIALNYLAIEANADKKYKDSKADTVVKTSPRVNSSVAPATVISLHYLTKKVIEESKGLATEYEARKAQIKQERHDKIASIQTNIQSRTKDVLDKIPVKRKTDEK